MRRRSSDHIFAFARPEHSRAQALPYHAQAWLCPWTTPWNAMELGLGSVFLRLSPCSFPGTRRTGNKTFLTARELMTTGKTSQIMIKNKIGEHLVLLKATWDTGVAVLWSHQDSLPGVQTTCPRPSHKVRKLKCSSPPPTFLVTSLCMNCSRILPHGISVPPLNYIVVTSYITVVWYLLMDTACVKIKFKWVAMCCKQLATSTYMQYLVFLVRLHGRSFGTKIRLRFTWQNGNNNIKFNLSTFHFLAAWNLSNKSSMKFSSRCFRTALLCSFLFQ